MLTKGITTILEPLCVTARFFDVHTHLAVPGMETHSLVSILPEQPKPLGFFFSVGIHPWTIGEVDLKQQLRLIELIAKEPECVAIGECGLDRSDALRIGSKLIESTNYDSSSVANLTSERKRQISELGFSAQVDLFNRHVEIANIAEKPIIIHCVRAYQKLMELKKKSGSTVPWVLHGFRGSAGIANSLIDHGFHISFGRSLIRRNSKGWGKNASALRRVPLDRLMLETDDTESPASEIGKLYEVVATIKKISVDTLSHHIAMNADRIFKLKLNP